MTTYSSTHDDWLRLKHQRSDPVYSYGCARDYADVLAPRAGYNFVSSESPVQLRNNSGGMDEDNIKTANAWHPQQQAAQQQVQMADCEMSDDTSSGDDYDMDMEDDDSCNPTYVAPQKLQLPVHIPSKTVNKKKRGAESLEELENAMNTFDYQPQIAFDSTKRMRVKA